MIIQTYSINSMLGYKYCSMDFFLLLLLLFSCFFYEIVLMDQTTQRKKKIKKWREITKLESQD